MKKTKYADKIIADIKSLIEKYGNGIPFAFLFGSRAEGRQTPLSDIDVAVYFRDMCESEKTVIEQKVSLLFNEEVNILRLEDENISPLIKIEALKGIPIIIEDTDLLNKFILSIIHRAEELRSLLRRLRRVA